MPDLATALAHLDAFRATFNDDDLVDEESGLTAADLSVVIEAATQSLGMVAIRSIDLRDLHKEV